MPLQSLPVWARDPRFLYSMTGLSLFLALGIDVLAAGYLATHLDPAVQDAFPPGGPLAPVAQVLTHLGGWVVLTAAAAVAVIALARRGRLADALTVTVGGLGGAGVVRGAKWIVGRPRPGVHATDLTAFPSGHAANSLIVWGLVLVLLWRPGRRAWAVVGSVTGLVGLTRVVLGVHWATDVLGGWALGGAWLAMTLFVRSRFEPTSAPSDASSRPSNADG